MRKCESCGAEAAASQEVCGQCGARLEGRTESLPNVEGVLRELSEEFAGAEEPMLVVIKGPEVGEKFFLSAPSLTIGRDPACDIFLNDVTVSRKHAVITNDSGCVTIRDAGSLNGTYVNDQCPESAKLENGDHVQIGRFQMIFFSGGGD